MSFELIVGPMQPLSFYEAELEKVVAARQQLIDYPALMRKNKKSFILSQVYFDQLFIAARDEESLRRIVVLLKEREALYEEHILVLAQAEERACERRRAFALRFKLPDISAYADNKNIYAVLPVEEVSSTYLCVCGVYAHIEYEHTCAEKHIIINTIKIKSRPNVANKFSYNGVFYPTQGKIKRIYRKATRSVVLSRILRDILVNFNNRRKPASFRIEYKEIFNFNEFNDLLDIDNLEDKIGSVPYIEAQMADESAHGDCQQLNQEQHENVILTTHAEESVAEPILILQDNWEKLCSSQQIQEYTQLMSRWQAFHSFKWSKDQRNNTNLFSDYALPKDFYTKNASSPNCLIFKQYAYFRSDMEIKIVINTNKFHCGALQLSFYYGGNLDSCYNDRNNIYSASQMTHCIVDAASATDGILKIPYRYYKPLLATTSRDDDTDVLNLGYLRCFVLNSLKVAKDATSEVDVSMFIRFVNPSFHGMKPSDMGVVNQMFSTSTLKAVVNTTANLVNQIFPDPQRDNPSDVIPPKPMVPWSAHSWCIGDVCPEPTNPLRLQASGSTTHPPGTLPEEPEMEIDYVKRIFGLVKQISWSKDDARGAILKIIPFSPIWRWDEYPSVKISNTQEQNCGVLPPISVLSELFAYWRGSIEYRFDFVATQFHTGRLIVAYLPRLPRQNQPSLDDLTSCDHVIIDLREERQINYVCSYLSDKPWWPRRKSSRNSTEFLPPGYIYIAVLNCLQVTQNISPDVDINIYMRAGSDFEFHVPVNPQVGLSFNTNILPVGTSSVTYLAQYGPPYTSIYVGTWHSAGSGNVAIFRYGPVSDHVTQFDFNDAKKKFVYKLQNPVINIMLPQDNKTVINYLVLFTDGVYAYGCPFETYAKAKLFVSSLNEYAIPTDGSWNFCVPNSVQGDYLLVSERMYWQRISSEDFEIIEQAGEERSLVCGETVNVQTSVNTTYNGLLTFGEQITNLKQVCRRYVPYGQFISLKATKDVNPSLADFAFPVMPHGLDLVIKNTDGREHVYGNRMRDGPIGLIASGYRFYRGSVRFRIVITGKEEGVFWVQHRPEYALRSLNVFKPDSHYVDAYFQPGYAYMVQLSQMNNVVEFEVPFYLPGQFGMLQRPNMTIVEDAVHYSLGTIYCGFDTMKGSPSDFPYFAQIFYSIGDDMTFSVFQGFPPMLDLSIFNEPEITAQGPMDWMKKKMVELGAEVGEKIIEKAVTEGPEQAQIPDSIKTTGIKTNDIVTLVKQHLSGVDEAKQSVIVAIISNLVHSIINPSITQIAWSIASIFVQIGILALGVLDKFVSVCSKFLERFNHLVGRSKKSEQDPQVVAQGPEDSDTEIEAALVSTCVTGMLAMVQATNKPLPKTLPNFASYLYAGLPKFTLTANGLFRFVKNNLLMFKKMWYWLVSFFNKDYLIFKELDGASEDVIFFVKRCQWCMDARNRDSILNDPKATLQVYELANLASSFLAKKAVSNIAKHLYVLDMYCRGVIKLRDELTALMKSPAIRFEPYVICLQGDSNVGKSHLANTIARELLESIDYKSYNELTYVRTPGNAYWNGLNNQPVLIFDDFLNIEDSQHSLLQIGELFCLKSKAVFNPPMAAIEEKNLRYNPLIVILLCNKAYPKIPGLALEEAWMRRRDIMLNVSKKAEYLGVHPRKLAKDVAKEYKHLDFFEFVSSTTPEGYVNDVPLSYGETLSRLVKEFHVYFQEECQQYNSALEKLRTFHPDVTSSHEDYCKTIENKVKEINNHRERIKPEELAFLNEQFNIIKAEKYTADMTAYVRKQILNKKLADLESEISTKKAIESLKKSTNNFTAIPPKIMNPIVSDPSQPSTSTAPMEAQAQGPPTMYPELIVDRKYGFTGTCRHLEALFCAKKYTPINGEPGVMEHGFHGQSVFVPNKETDLNYCVIRPSECLLLQKEKLTEWYIDHKSLFDNMVDDCLPCCIYEIKKELESKVPAGQVRNLTSDEIDDVLRAEIGNKAWYEKLWGSIPEWSTIWRWLAKITIVIGAIGCLIRMAGYMIASPFEAKAKVETSQAGLVRARVTKEYFSGAVEDQSTNYSLGAMGAKANPAIAAKVIGQAGIQDATILNKIIRNTFFLSASFTEGEVRKHRLFRCLGLINHKFVILDHYLYFLLSVKDLVLEFVKDGCAILIPNSVLKCSRVVNSALCVAEMHKTIPEFVNIIKFIAPSAVTKNLSPAATLYEYVLDPQSQRFVMKCNRFSRVERKEHISILNDDGSDTLVNSVFEYSYGGRGVCCSVLVSDMNTPSPIIGLHVAGVNGSSQGFAEAIVRETFDGLIKKGDVQIIAESAHSTILYDKAPIMNLEGNVIQIGTIPREHAMYPPSISRLMLSDCAGVFSQVTYDKPVLHSGDARIREAPFSPLLEGCKHHANPCLPFPDEFVARAAEDVENMILSKCKPLRLNIGKLSYEEAICGILHNPDYEPMDMNTAEGFPWILSRPNGATNKSWLFEREITPDGPKLLSIHKDLLYAMDRKDYQRRRGLYPQTVFTDCLKDAKLPSEKVLLPGKTRIFSISPVDFTIQQRQYSMDFSVAYNAARFDVEGAIGISIHSIDADALVNRMLSFSPKFVCGDYSKFGDQLYAECIHRVYEIIAKWYAYNGCTDESFPIVLKCFSREVSYAHHLMLNQLYVSCGGMPSGNPLTAMINSLVNSMYIRIIWQVIMVKCSPGLIDMKSFNQNVIAVTYGDDLWLAIKEAVLAWYNARTMSAAFATYGIKFTNALKAGEIKEYSLINDPDTTFLKCTFVKHPIRRTLWMAQLERRATFEICNWIWNTSRDTQQSSIEACSAMMESMFGHGQEEYETMRFKMLSYWQRRGVRLHIPDWQAMDIRIYGLE